MHYLIDGTIGSKNKVILDSRFAFDIGPGFEIVKKPALLPGWERQAEKGDDFQNKRFEWAPIGIGGICLVDRKIRKYDLQG